MPCGAPELSVVVLCYRAQEGLRLVVEPLHEELVSSGVPYELVLVANYWQGTADETPREAEALPRGIPRS